MPLDLTELKRLHDKAYSSGLITRERASDDLVFQWLSQWDDRSLAESPLAYRGEFNILRRAIRQIEADLTSNPVQVDFEPIGETGEDSAKMLDGIYRTDDTYNTSIEAYNVAAQEAIVCGFGAWELYTEYVSMQPGDRNQVIRRRPINEANNVVLYDPNATLLDKSDADHCSVLVPYTDNGYKKLVKELTGKEVTDIEGSFKEPAQSFTFPWLSGAGKSKTIWVVNFYHRRKIETKIYTLTDPFGDSIQMWQADFNEEMDQMIDAGFSIDSDLTKEVERWEVTKYIASGISILSSDVIAGQNIPIIPMYGEHAYVEGEEHYEGATRLAKDPQRLRNFVLSYLADIVSTSPRNKPIFWPEQIAGHEYMYEKAGADNQFPFYYMNRKGANGDDLIIGPVAEMPEQKIPEALIALIKVTREAVEDVANPGLFRDIADPDVSRVISGRAILALQARLDMQSLIYQQHSKHAKRRDAQVYASMVSEIYDVPRKVKLTLPDGTRKDGEVMEQIIDEETGDIKTVGDLHNAEFEVYTKIGPSYKSQKDQVKDELTKLYQGTVDSDPLKRILLLKIVEMTEGDTDEIRDYARRELILAGVKEPDTDKEKQMLAEAQEKEEPSAEMVYAQAEMLKGQADKMEAELKRFKIQLDDQNKKMDIKVDAFEAQTKRFEAQTDAEEADAEIDYKRADKLGKDIENMANLKALTDDELIQRIGAG